MAVRNHNVEYKSNLYVGKLELKLKLADKTEPINVLLTNS